MTEYTARSRCAAVQAEPVWLDADRTIDKAIDLIKEAKERGADLVGFPELFIPGYPWYVWLGSQKWAMQFWRRYHENSLTTDGERMRRLRDAARANEIAVVMGYSERSGGSLYMGQAIIAADGELVAARRKLKPTHVERAVFGDGSGKDLKVWEFPFGRLGAFNCWEHFQTLPKYAMYSQDEQIHVASWPSFGLYGPDWHTTGLQIAETATRMYAVEGQVFVVSSSQVTGSAAHEAFCDTEDKKELIPLGGGWARIFGPDGRDLAEPLDEHAEGVIVADIDLGDIAVCKFGADPVGHYARPDVVSLRFDPSPRPVVEYVRPDVAATAEGRGGGEEEDEGAQSLRPGGDDDGLASNDAEAAVLG